MEHVVIGKIVNTRGLKGELKVVNFSDFIESRYKKGNEINIFCEASKEYFKETIASFSQSEKFVYVKFSKLNTIEAVEKYKNCLIVCDVDDLDELEEDSYHYHQLINLIVYYEKKEIGIIREVITIASKDLIRVGTDKKNFLVPFEDEFIEKIDLENKAIYLKNLKGLI